ncbi:ABC transporter substrate-binding protein [Rhizobium leguminosarum]
MESRFGWHAKRASAGCPIVGVLLAGDKTYPSFAAFCEQMHELGYRDGETARFEARFAEGRLDELPALASDLVQCGADVIAVVGAVTYWAARSVAPDIPIVFAIVLDPVSASIVDKPERPGGRTTGCTNFDPGQIREQIRILKRVIPGLCRLAVLGDAGVPDILPNLSKTAAQAECLDAHIFLLKGENDLAPAFAEFAAAGTEALLCLEVPRTTTYGAEIVRLATAARLPAIFGRDHARYGPLISYGTSLAAAASQMANQVDEILRGTEPGDIPVQYVRRLELVINLNAARQIEVSLPSDLIVLADQVIE